MSIAHFSPLTDHYRNEGYRSGIFYNVNHSETSKYAVTNVHFLALTAKCERKPDDG